MSSRSHARSGDDLTDLIRSNAWLMRVLRAVRDEQIPGAWVGAGVLRDLVWGERYGAGFSSGEVRDVDVAFFDPHDLSSANDDRVTQRLRSRLPDVPWEAKNQAAVHTWYAATFGGAAVEPLTSIRDAVGTWPETATAVAVRLGADDVIEVCAPLGVDDLLDGVWRRNPRRVDVQRSVERLARHQPATRWPGVSVVPPETVTAPAAFPDRTVAVLVAFVAALAVAFIFAPPRLAADGDLADPGRLGAAFRAAMVGYWSSGDRDYPPDLQRVVDYWFRFHLVKGGIAALLLGVLTVLLWRSLRAGGLRLGNRVASGAAASLLALFALVLVMANVQGALAPFASLLPFLTEGTPDADLADALAQARQQLAGSPHTGGYTPPALDVMVGELVWYHAALAVIAAFVVVALLGLSALSWRSFARAGSTERGARRAWAWFGVGSALSALIMAVVLVANVGTARNPAPALLSLFNGGF